MKQTKYQQTPPAGMFTVTVKGKARQESRYKICYDYTYTVALRPTTCDFVTQFAELVAALGKSPAAVFAARMGVSEQQLVVTIGTLTGAGVREWCDTFACAVGEALLRKTDWTVGQVAVTVGGFRSVVLFSYFWKKKYKCSPSEWRRRHM